MKTLKYGLSGLVMAALTLLFLCIPTLYYRLTDRENANVSTREIYLEQTADPLTPSQTIRLLHDNASTGLFSRVQNNRSTDEYLAKAPTLIQAVCGPASYLTKLLIGRLPGPAAVTVETYRFLTMSGYDVLTRTVVMAYFGDLYICYEEETEVVLAIAVLGEGGNAYSTNEFSAAVDENDYPDRYYQGLGLESGKDFQRYAFDGLSKYRLYIGIYDYTVEKKGQFDQMIQP